MLVAIAIDYSCLLEMRTTLVYNVNLTYLYYNNTCLIILTALIILP